MIVVDTNIIGYLYLTSQRSGQAEKALLREPDWAAPILWRSELRNVLASYLRRNLLSLDEASQIMEEAESRLAGNEYEVASIQVLRLVDQSSCTAYDCEFVALAQDLGTRLVTVDRQILEQFQDTAVSLEDFCAGR